MREAQQYLADWNNPEQQDFLIRRPRAMQGKLDEWRGKPSGNFLPGFHLSRQERGLRGELVLQLV